MFSYLYFPVLPSFNNSFEHQLYIGNPMDERVLYSLPQIFTFESYTLIYIHLLNEKVKLKLKGNTKLFFPDLHH